MIKMFDIKILKNFPPDVATLICSFGYPEYKEHMKKIRHQLTQQFTLLEYNMYLMYDDYYRFIRDYDSSLLEYLATAIEDKVLENLFIQCTKCKCCSKHCHNRPMNYYTDEVSIGENFDTECQCTCRQLSRFIKRSTELSLEKNNSHLVSFNTQFIPQSSQSLQRRAQFHLAIPLVQP